MIRMTNNFTQSSYKTSAAVVNVFEDDDHADYELNYQLSSTTCDLSV